MAGMLTQLPLPLLPAGAAEIAAGVGLVAGEDGGGLVSVHGLATFAWDGGDEAGRRLAAVQLVRLRAVSQAQAAAAFGVDPVTVWRWDQALAAGGVAGLVPSRRGPKGASKLTPQLIARIGELDAAGATLSEIAAATGVSTFSVRNALGRVPSGGWSAAGTAEGSAALVAGDEDAGQGPVVPVLPDPVPREAERALARWGLLGEGAVPVFTLGARYPLAGLLLALPALEGAGLLDAARQVYGQLRDGFYGLTATLLTLVFLALAGEPRAEGATRVPPAALGRVLGLDRAPEVKTIRRKLGELAAAGPPPRGGPAGHARVFAHRRACPGLLRDPGRAEDPRGAAEVPRPGHHGDLGHRPGRRSGVHGRGRAVGLTRRRAAPPAARSARHRGPGPAGDGVLRPGRLVPGPVRRHHRGRVRPAHLAQGPGPRHSRRRVHHDHVH